MQYAGFTRNTKASNYSKKNKDLTVKILFFAIFLAIASPAESAMLNAFKFIGVVQSFDQKNVKVLCQSRKIEIPNESITSGSIRNGEAVSFQLTGEQMQSLFFKKNSKPDKTH